MNILRKYKISKLTNKPLTGLEAEIINFMKNILFDLIPFKYEKYRIRIFFMNSKGEWVFEQDNEHKAFYVRYDTVWEVLQKKYLMKDNDIQIFIKYLVEESLNKKITTPIHSWLRLSNMIEENFKQNIGTVHWIINPLYSMLEDSFKENIGTPVAASLGVFTKLEEEYKCQQKQEGL